MAFALPLAASAMAAAAPAAAAAATKVSLMAVAKSVLMNVAISAAMSAFQPQVGSAGKTFEWTLDPNAPIPFAAGRVGVAGTVAHLETYGPDKMYYGFVSVLSGAGPIKSVAGFKGDDETVTFDGNGKAISSQWAGEMWLRSRLGTQPDTALTNPPGLKNNAQLPGWSAANKMSGKACYMLVLGENSKRTAYPTGEPKPLVTIEGLFGWDPRQDSTYPGGVGACRLNNPATWVWLDNPILWALKWSLGLWEGPIGKGAPGVDYQVGGIGAKIEGIDVPAFVAAANVADANGWKVAAYPTTDDDKAQVLDSFLQAGGAIYSERAGRISCIQRAAPRASVITISAADTAGPLEIDTAASRLDRINTIRPRFWDENSRWQMTAIDDVSADAYRAQDGAVRPRGIDYPYVPLATQAAQLAALQIANTREGIAGTIPLKPHLRNITPGTAFTITEPGFLLDGLKCLALNVDYNPMTGVVSVDFVSETDAKYPFALGQSPIAPVPPALTAPDLTVTPPAVGEWTLAAATFTHDGVSVPALLFAGAVDNSRAQSVIFEFRPLGTADWSGAGVEDPTISRKEAAGGLLTPGVQYQGAVSYRVGGNISERLILGPVTAGDLVSGDVSPITPANVAGVPTIAVATLIAPDGTQISRLTGTWGAAADGLSYVVELDNGTVVVQLPAATNAISQIVPTGPTYRYRVKALSRTGTLSAAWSAWSGNGVAAGDVTAPGAVTGVYCQAGPKFIALGWGNPADADLRAVVIYRNTVNNAGTASLLRIVDGTYFTDTTVTPGTTYYYWASTVDRSGNEGVRTSLGAATARYINIGGGDIRFDDPDLVTDYGISAGYRYQTRFGTALTLSLADSDIAAPWSALESRPAVTQGSAITEDPACADPPAWYVGSSAIAFVTITDGEVARTAMRGASGNALSERAVPIDAAKTYMLEGWYRSVGGATTAFGVVSIEDGSGTPIVGDGTYFAYHPAGSAIPTVWTYYSRVFGAGTAKPIPSNGCQARVGYYPNYAGSAYQTEVQGLQIVEVVRIGGSLYRADGTVATESQIVTGLGTAAALVGQGSGATANNLAGLNGPEGAKLFGIAPNAGTSLTLVGTDAYALVSGNTVANAGGGATWTTGGAYTKDRYVGSAYVSARAKAASTFQQFGLAAIAYVGETPPDANYLYISYGWYVFGTDYAEAWVGGSGQAGYTSAGGTVDSVYSTTYDGTHIRWFRDGVLKHGPLAVAPGLAMRAHFSIATGGDYAGFRDIQFGPYSQVPRLGSNINNSAGTGQYGEGDLVTIVGVAGSYLGQTGWGTLTRAVTAISKIDDAGRIIDGQALPLNGMSKSSTLSPAIPLSPGPTPSTQISVAASTVTFAGGTTLSLPSATLTGLTASTYYSIFRDLVASAYVAVSGSTTAYFTSAQRYLYIGTQLTEEVGGGYETPPPPPPGYGGGFGDRPLYVEP